MTGGILFNHSYDLTFSSGTWTKTDEVYYGKHASLRYDGPNQIGFPGVYNWGISLDWSNEIAFLDLYSPFSWCRFVPQDSGDYIQSTSRPDLTGTQLWKGGCFDWSGSTVLFLCTEQAERSGREECDLELFRQQIHISLLQSPLPMSHDCIHFGDSGGISGVPVTPESPSIGVTCMNFAAKRVLIGSEFERPVRISK